MRQNENTGVPMPSTNRRRFLRIVGPGGICLVAGCSTSAGTATGELFVRTRNMTTDRQRISITVFVSDEETPSVEETATIPAATGGSPPWPEHIARRRDVRATESYRVVAEVNGQQYEYQDTANCISRNRESETELTAHHELVSITVQSDEVQILSGDCPLESGANS